MSNIIAIDPGRRKLAWAVFAEKELLVCNVEYLDKKEQFDLNRTILQFLGGVATNLKDVDVCETAIVERMKIYPGKGSKGDQNFLLDLQAIGAACGSKLAKDLKMVLPMEWKKNWPKAVCNARVRKALNDEEREYFEKQFESLNKEYQQDLLDAVGIGLSHLGRLF